MRPAHPLQPAAAEPELPMLHRLAVVYLMLPVFVWLVGWFEWWFGIPAAALLAGALRRPLSGRWRLRAPTPAEAAVLAVAALWVLATPAGGVFHPQNADFFEHRVTLLDMARHPWPTYLPDPLAAWRPAPAEGPPATPTLLRYYLGWHMVPGLAARWLGPSALGWAIPLWTWAGMALVALLFTRGRRGRALVIALAVLVFFSSSMSLVSAAIEGSVSEGWKWWTDWLTGAREWYDPLVAEPRFLRTLSATITLKMDHYHILPAGLYTLLCLHLCRQPRFLAVLGVLLAAAPFWSAFVAVGLLPLLAVVLWMNGVRPLLRWPNLGLAGPLFGVVVLYLASGVVDFPQGWIWQREGYDWPRLMRRLPVFYLTEFLLLAVLLAAVRPGLRREPFFIAAVTTLLLLPVYYYGQSAQSNDLLVRGSLPALFVLGWHCAGAVARGGGALVRRGGRRRWAAFAGLVLVLGVGALNPAAHLVRSFQQYGPYRYEHAERYTTLVDLPPLWRLENTAPDVPDLLRRLLREPAPFPERRIPNEPVIQSGFDVYLDDGTLVYVKDRCAPEDVVLIFVKVAPVSPEDLPAHRRRKGSRHDQLPAAFPERLGDRCLASRSLPTYPVARVVTGQRPWRLEQGRLVNWIIWKAEAALGGAQGVEPSRPSGHR